MYPVTVFDSNPFFGEVTFPVTVTPGEPETALEGVEFDYDSSPFVDAPKQEAVENSWLETVKSISSFISSLFKSIQTKISAFTSNVKVEDYSIKFSMPQMDFCPEELLLSNEFINSFFEQASLERAKRRIADFYSIIVN